MIEDQRGKLMQFILIGVVLLSVLTGGLYAAKLYSQNQTAKESTPPQETAKTPTQPQVPKEQEQTEPAEETAAPSAQPNQPTAQSQSAPTAQVGAATIPASGPELTGLAIIAVGFGTFLIAHLLRMRLISL